MIIGSIVTSTNQGNEKEFLTGLHECVVSDIKVQKDINIKDKKWTAIKFEVKSIHCGVSKEISFLMSNRRKFNSDMTKVQICNSYGQFSWVESSLIKDKMIDVSEYCKGTCRPAYEGEENLSYFIRAYFNKRKLYLKDVTFETYVKMAESDFAKLVIEKEDIDNWFNGDIKELRENFKSLTGQKVGIIFTVDDYNTDSPRQSFYSRMFFNAGYISDSYLPKVIERLENDTRYAATSKTWGDKLLMPKMFLDVDALHTGLQVLNKPAVGMPKQEEKMEVIEVQYTKKEQQVVEEDDTSDLPF